MSTLLLIPVPNAEPVAITVDATISQIHEHTADVTENPVENGSDTSDNYRAKPDSFTLDVIFSDQPLRDYPDFTGGNAFELRSLDFGNGRGALVLQSDTRSNRTQRVYDTLLETQKSGTLIEVVTARRRYINVAITSITVTRNKRNGDALFAKISFRSLVLVETTAAPAAVPRVRWRRRGSNAGAQSGTSSEQGDGVSRSRLAQFTGVGS